MTYEELKRECLGLAGDLQQLADIEGELLEKRRGLRDEIDELSALSSKVEELAGPVSSLLDEMKERTEQSVDGVGRALEELKTSCDGLSEEVLEDCKARLDGALQRIEAHRDQLAARFDAMASTLLEGSQSHAEKLQSSVTQSKQELLQAANNAEASVKEVRDRLVGARDSIVGLMEGASAVQEQAGGGIQMAAEALRNMKAIMDELTA